MKEIKVLGSGCPKCEELLAQVKDLVSQEGLDCQVVKVSDITEIVAAGVMMTPALMVDGEVKSVGKVPDRTEILSWLK